MYRTFTAFFCSRRGAFETEQLDKIYSYFTSHFCFNFIGFKRSACTMLCCVGLISLRTDFRVAVSHFGLSAIIRPCPHYGMLAWCTKVIILRSVTDIPKNRLAEALVLWMVRAVPNSQ